MVISGAWKARRRPERRLWWHRWLHDGGTRIRYHMGMVMEGQAGTKSLEFDRNPHLDVDGSDRPGLVGDRGRSRGPVGLVARVRQIEL